MNIIIRMLGTSHINFIQNEHLKHLKAHLNVQEGLNAYLSNVMAILGRLKSKHHQTLDID